MFLPKSDDNNPAKHIWFPMMWGPTLYVAFPKNTLGKTTHVFFPKSDYNNPANHGFPKEELAPKSLFRKTIHVFPEDDMGPRLHVFTEGWVWKTINLPQRMHGVQVTRVFVRRVALETNLRLFSKEWFGAEIKCFFQRVVWENHPTIQGLYRKVMDYWRIAGL